MLTRFIKFALVGLVAVMLIGLIRDFILLSGLRSEASHLQGLVGRLNPDPSDQIHVVANAADFPSHVQWRLLLPANHTWRQVHRSSLTGGSGRNEFPTSQQTDQWLRWQIVREENEWQPQFMHSHGATTSVISDQVYDYLTEHINELDVQIAGSDGQTSIDSDKILTLLKISIPESLHDEMKQELGAREFSRLRGNPLLEVRIGTESSFLAEEAAKAAKAKASE